ncbi:alpha/beta fold hydrolase [Nocardia sp. NPDC051833]|uniref:alpha/beta hydrolase n=1 Tax=Nocardia sp. NPDC051833 TaxID=3155674 RepID=UPI00342CD933
MKDIAFPSHGVSCAAWHLAAQQARVEDGRRRPCVVMAAGIGGTRMAGLLGFAAGFTAAGMDVLLFDYRGFGDSDGRRRQDVSYRRQREDYHAAIAAARHLPGVDADKIVVWGTSYSGGHVVAVAAQDPRVAAVVAMTPATDGAAALVHLTRNAGAGALIRLAGHGLFDLLGSLGGREHYIPVAGQPGSVALLTTSGAEEAYVATAGSTWRNEVRARSALEVCFNRPITHAGRVRRPMLVQVGINDRIAPPSAARRTVQQVGEWGRLREYPVDHFDVYDGPWQQRLLDDQIAFLAEVID